MVWFLDYYLTLKLKPPYYFLVTKYEWVAVLVFPVWWFLYFLEERNSDFHCYILWAIIVNLVWYHMLYLETSRRKKLRKEGEVNSLNRSCDVSAEKKKNVFLDILSVILWDIIAKGKNETVTYGYPWCLDKWGALTGTWNNCSWNKNLCGELTYGKWNDIFDKFKVLSTV